MYFVKATNADPLREITWGYFSSLKQAKVAVENNHTDMNEAGWYPYAVISDLPEGLCQLPRKLYWFKFDRSTGKYVPCKQPNWSKRYAWALP